MSELLDLDLDSISYADSTVNIAKACGITKRRFSRILVKNGLSRMDNVCKNHCCIYVCVCIYSMCTSSVRFGIPLRVKIKIQILHAEQNTFSVLQA